MTTAERVTARVIVTALCTLPLLGLACAEDHTPRGQAYGGGGTGGTVEPVPCTDGEEQACEITLEENNGVYSCLPGTQRCVDGQWGECTTSTHTFGVPPDEDAEERSQPMSLSPSQPCVGNFCDPACGTFLEVPSVPINPPTPVTPLDECMPDQYEDVFRDDAEHGPDYLGCTGASDCQADSWCDTSVSGGPLSNFGICTTHVAGGQTPGCVGMPDITVEQVTAGNLSVCNRGDTATSGDIKVAVVAGSEPDIIAAAGTCSGIFGTWVDGCCRDPLSGEGNCVVPPDLVFRNGCTLIGDKSGTDCCPVGFGQTVVPAVGTGGTLIIEEICYAPGPIAPGTCVAVPGCDQYLDDFPRLMIANSPDLDGYDGVPAEAECECGNNMATTCYTVPYNCGVRVGGGLGKDEVIPGGFVDKLIKDVLHSPYLPCTQPGDCNADSYCDLGSGACIQWGVGEYDATLGDFDFTVGVPCEGYLPVCNRGNVVAPPGVKVMILNGNSTQLQGNFGLCLGFGGTIDHWCTVNQEIQPGECLNATSCLPILPGPNETRTLIVNGPDYAPPYFPETVCENNHSAFSNNFGYLCEYDPTSVTINEVYAPDCPPGTRVQWGYFAYDATVAAPEGLRIKAHTAHPPWGETLSAVPPCSDCITLADVPATHPQICPMSGPSPCPINVFSELDPDDTLDDELELVFEFIPDVSDCSYASLSAWELTYTCIDYE